MYWDELHDLALDGLSSILALRPERVAIQRAASRHPHGALGGFQIPAEPDRQARTARDGERTCAVDRARMRIPTHAALALKGL